MISWRKPAPPATPRRRQRLGRGGDLGASMVSMVANLTLDKKGYEDFQADTRDILDQVMKGIGTLKELTLKEHGSLRRLHEMH